ncbi:hypothetical protein [Klebsiella oxytoca]|uniref:Uncharacterized protein n=1 Tax=Klebsiella oxytoca TaxID=571 RepID=A0A6B8MXP9_KLEOX|nr:hypothetical protein [Klebsiella oxytoca]QGN39596.1 hypothetical protein GJ746_20845 [Klebsiella oxytoca]
MKYRVGSSSLLISSAGIVFSLETQAEKKTQVVSILEGKATIELPVEFVRVPQEFHLEMYPDETNQPQESWYVETERGIVSIVFSVTENATKEADVPGVVAIMKEELKAFSPSLLPLDINGHKMVRLAFNIPDADENEYLHHLTQVSSFNGKLMFVIFKVTSDLESQYKSAGEAALSSLKY